MADILIAPGSTMPAAPAGEVTLFLNTENNNVLSYINDAGAIFVYNSGDTSVLEECCSCEIAKKWISAVTCALESGMLTATQFGTITNQGLIVTSTEVVDAGTGAKTCTVEIGPKLTVEIPITATGISVEGDVYKHTIDNIGDTYQIPAVTIDPLTSPQGVTYYSTNVSFGTVNSTGLVTRVSAGDFLIVITSINNPALVYAIIIS